MGARSVPRTLTPTLGAFALSATLVLAACGGGGSSDTVELSNFATATVVIGKPDFGHRLTGSVDANTVSQPYGNVMVTADDGLFIGDYGSNRVLGFRAVPTANNANADFVLGQADFTSSEAHTRRNGFDGPRQVAADDAGHMIVTDALNSRILIYRKIPSSGSTRPDAVVGQPDFTSSTRACGRAALNEPEVGQLTPDGKLVVTDTGNNRVLIWNRLPTRNGQPADIVLGQADFTHCAANDDNQDGAADAGPSSRTLHLPGGVWSDGKRLAVVDIKNNRVLIWAKFPTGNFQPADLVLGQKNFQHAAPNDDNQDGNEDARPSARTFYNPVDGISSNGTQLALADQGNCRVLIWNHFPTKNFQPADVVLGQSNFRHRAPNDADQDGVPDSTPSSNTLYSPAGAYFYDNQLIVSDNNNSRILIFESE